VELLNSGIQNKDGALRAWSHRGWQRKVFLCSNHYVAVGCHVLFNAPERVLLSQRSRIDPQSVKMYLLEIQTVVVFDFGYVGQD